MTVDDPLVLVHFVKVPEDVLDSLGDTVAEIMVERREVATSWCTLIHVGEFADWLMRNPNVNAQEIIEMLTVVQHPEFGGG